MPFPGALEMMGHCRFRTPVENSTQWRAFETFKRMASADELGQLQHYSGVFIKGRMADYVVKASGGTVVLRGTEVIATGCLVLTMPDDGTYLEVYPGLDHFIANYLVLKSQERYYWKTAILSVRDVGQGRVEEVRRELERERERAGSVPRQTWAEWLSFTLGD